MLNNEFNFEVNICQFTNTNVRNAVRNLRYLFSLIQKPKLSALNAVQRILSDCSQNSRQMEAQAHPVHHVEAPEDFREDNVAVGRPIY